MSDVGSESSIDGHMTDKQKVRLRKLAERAGVTYEEAISKNMSQVRDDKRVVVDMC